MKVVRRISVFAALIVIFVQLFIPASMAIATSMTNTKVADWRNTQHLQLITLAVGDSITLTDTNERLAAFAQQTMNTANLKITKSGRGTYAIAKAADVGTSFVYTKGSQQKIVNFKLSNNGEFSLPIKVNLNGKCEGQGIHDRY